MGVNTVGVTLNSAGPFSEYSVKLITDFAVGEVLCFVQGTVWAGYTGTTLASGASGFENLSGAGICYVPTGGSAPGYSVDQGQDIWINRVSAPDSMKFPIWAPSSATAAYQVWQQIRINWRGYFRFSAASDLYCCTGGDGPISPTPWVTGTIRVGWVAAL